MITCKKCGQEKSDTEFGKHKFGWRKECKACVALRQRKHYDENREAYFQRSFVSYLKRLYGLSIEQYDKMVAEQDNKCWICRRPEPQGTRLSVDHCHETNTVRGLLCRTCNQAIGLLQHNTDLISRAAQYLSKGEVM